METNKIIQVLQEKTPHWLEKISNSELTSFITWCNLTQVYNYNNPGPLADAFRGYCTGLQLNKEEIERLENELETLQRTNLIGERKNGDENDIMDASQEAAHYNWLDDQNSKLTAVNQTLRAMLVETQKELQEYKFMYEQLCK